MNGNKIINNRFIIFGGTGDLTYRKLIPAFYNMLIKGNLNETDQIKIVGRRDLNIDEYAEMIKPWVKSNARFPFDLEVFNRLVSIISYCKMDIGDISEYQKLKHNMEDNKAKQTIVYLAVAPKLFKVITEGLLSINQTEVSIVMEKPFGDTLEEAKALNHLIEDCFKKENLYMIDHYLGKEMVRNILTIRCANPLFENVWDHKHIESVVIEAAETVGVENRANYYDHTGALKDMVQNHLLQLLTIVALENPSDMASIKKQQLDILKSLYVDKTVAKSMILGQYQGYLDEPDVKVDSKTETFAALKLYLDLPRWHKVPFVITTGKKLNIRNTEVRITFKQPNADVAKNVLVIKIQPMEGVELAFNIKTPGKENGVMEAKLDFCQNCSDINRLNTPEAYEWMLESISAKEQFWFSEWNQIETSWRFIEDLHRRYRNEDITLWYYPPGSDQNEKVNILLKTETD